MPRSFVAATRIIPFHHPFERVPKQKRLIPISAHRRILPSLAGNNPEDLTGREH